MPQRAFAAYIATVCRPNLTFGFVHASQIVNQDARAVKALYRFIDHAKEEPKVGLKYFPIDTASAKSVVFADARFASNTDNPSQLGPIIAFGDRFGNANCLRYTSVKYKGVTQSILASQPFAAVHAFDSASTILVTLNDLFQRIIPLVFNRDSKICIR